MSKYYYYDPKVRSYTFLLEVIKNKFDSISSPHKRIVEVTEYDGKPLHVIMELDKQNNLICALEFYNKAGNKVIQRDEYLGSFDPKGKVIVNMS